MSSLALDPSAHSSSAAPTFIPPRSSSHGVAFSSPNSNSASPEQPISPPQRKSSKRPVSNTSEGWLAQSSEKKALTAQGPAATRSSRRHTHSHSHSHRAKSALERSDEAAWFAAPGLMHMAPSSRPPNDPPHDIGDVFIHAKNPPWSKEKEKVLLGPYDYLFGHPGKDIRAQLISAFNEWLRVPEESLTVITKVIGMLHTASLLVDDVEDSSLLRRGEPVAHNIFGIPQVINSANYVYFLALQELSTLRNPTAIQIFTEELLNLHRGQGMDLFWRDTLTCPTEADYLEMVSNKTGGLFRLAIKLMEAESSVLPAARTGGGDAATAGASASETAPAAAAAAPLADGLTCVPLINTIGLLFQVLDDLLNLSSPTYHARKGHAEDLTEGKFSFPVLHAVRSDPSNLVLLNVLRQKTTDPEVKRYAVEYMQRCGSFDYTRRVIAELERKAVREVGRLEERIGGREGKEGAARIRSILGRLKAL